MAVSKSSDTAYIYIYISNFPGHIVLVSFTNEKEKGRFITCFTLPWQFRMASDVENMSTL